LTPRPGALAAVFGARMFLIEPLASVAVPLIGQDWVWRLDIAATDLILPTAYWFFALSFPHYLSRRAGGVIAAVCGAFALAGLAGGPVIGELTLKCAEITLLAVIPYLSQAIIRAALDNEYGARLALLGWAICALAAVHDVLLENQLITGTNFLPLGCIAFFLSLSGALTQRSHNAFVRIELLADERTRQLQEKIAELELARAAAVSANIAKSRFLANMSHELRTPLNAILGFSEIIRDRVFGEEVSPRYSDYAGSIHMSGRHLLGLITDILDLAKIEEGKLEFLETRVELGDEARSLIGLLEPQTRRKNVSITVEAAGPSWVFADASALRQIVLNLLSNALKFTPAGGRITVAIGDAADGSVALAVKDNGTGIRPEDMERVFESFGQGRHDTRETNEQGTGLGLPICRGLIEAMGGSITIESTVDVGTTVTILLPARRRLDAELLPASASA
jgi:two-component system cell cycle sensor histidine kinase PleC